MNFYDRKFVRDLRRRVRREAKPKLWWRILAWRHWLAAGLRPLLPLVFCCFFNEWSDRGVLFALTCWAVVFAGISSQQVDILFRGDAALPALTQMPVISMQVWRKFAAGGFRAMSWLIFDGVVCWWFICYSKHVPFGTWMAALPVSVLLYGATIAIVVASQWKWCRFLWRAALYLFFFFFIRLLWNVHGGHATPEFLVANLREFPRAFIWVTPPGWVLEVAEWVLTPQRPFPAMAVGLLAVAAPLTFYGRRQLGQRYQFWLRGESLPQRRGRMNATVSPARPEVRVEELEGRIRSGQFLESKPGGGWFSRFLEPASVRGKSVHVLLLGQTVQWDSIYRNGLVLIILSALLAEIAVGLAPRESSHAGALLAGIVLLVSAGGLWVFGLIRPLLFPWLISRTSPRPSGLRHISMISLLPVEPEEVRRAIRRFNARRLVAALPGFLLAGLVGMLAFKTSLPTALADETDRALGGDLTLGASLLVGMRFALQAWVALLLLQPFFRAFHFLQGISSRFVNWLVPLSLAISVVGAFLGTVFWVTSNWAWYWQILSFFALGATSLVYEAHCFRFYCSRRSDLIRQFPSAWAHDRRGTGTRW